MHPLKIAKLDQSSRVEFGPLAFYHPLVADGDTPVRTGIQTSAPGYVAPRLAIGQPDLQGVWSNASNTRMTRPGTMPHLVMLYTGNVDGQIEIKKP